MFSNAGVIASAPFDDTSWDAVERLPRIDLSGRLIGLQAPLPLLNDTASSLCMSACSAPAIFGSANLVG